MKQTILNTLLFLGLSTMTMLLSASDLEQGLLGGGHPRGEMEFGSDSQNKLRNFKRALDQNPTKKSAVVAEYIEKELQPEAEKQRQKCKQLEEQYAAELTRENRCACISKGLTGVGVGFVAFAASALMVHGHTIWCQQ